MGIIDREYFGMAIANEKIEEIEMLLETVNG